MNLIDWLTHLSVVPTIIIKVQDNLSGVINDYNSLYGFKTYDGLADFGYKRHYRVRHIKTSLSEACITSTELGTPRGCAKCG